ncbi:MAG: pentapeptide repeat-containing protein [Armatimonadota bacterium]
MQEYANSRDQWPDERWKSYDGAPPDEARCQHEMYGEMRCGLPVFATGPDGEPLCIFHFSGERDPEKLRGDLAEAVARGAHLWKANLEGCDLHRLDLRDAHLPRANLTNAVMTNIRTENADLYAAQMQGADLRGAKIEANADLRTADLSGARLAWAEISTGARIHDVTWAAEGDVLEDERQARRTHSPQERLELLQQCAAAYRQIKQNYQDSGDYQRAGDFFLREMECRRAQMSISTPGHPPAPLLTRFLWWLMYSICGYGERPFQIAKSSALLVLLFAVLHGLAGIRVPSGAYVVGPGLVWPPDIELVYGFFRALYFSVVTFTSLGYGDLQPGPALGKALAAIEVVIGVFCMSLFLVTVTRRWSR